MLPWRKVSLEPAWGKRNCEKIRNAGNCGERMVCFVLIWYVSTMGFCGRPIQFLWAWISKISGMGSTSVHLVTAGGCISPALISRVHYQSGAVL